MADEPEVEEIDTLRDDLSAAFDALETGGAEPAVKTSPTPAAEEQAGAAEPAGGPARDQAGRFASKAAADTAGGVAADPAAQTIPVPGQSAAAEAPRPPASWGPQEKADFAALPVHIQKQIAKRESEITDGLAQTRDKAAAANRWDEVFAPHKARLAMRGIDQFQEVANLLQARDILERDPVGGLRALAGSLGINLSQLGQANGRPQAAPQGQPQPPAYLQGLMRDVADLKGSLTQQRQAQESEIREANRQALQQFAADPANLYLENVRGDVAALLRSGQAKGASMTERLKDAYDRAIWAHPEIRPVLLKQQQAEAQAAAQASASAKVSRARSAAGSVTGSPTQGSSPSSKTNPSSSLSDDISSAWDELVGA